MVEKTATGEWRLCSQAPLLIEVLGEYGVVFKITAEQLEKMKRLGQVEANGSGEWVLTKQGKLHQSTTRISNGKSVKAAIGMSQDYTERDKGRVWKFKPIDSNDRPAFQVGALFHDDPLFDDEAATAAEAERARIEQVSREWNEFVCELHRKFLFSQPLEGADWILSVPGNHAVWVEAKAVGGT